MLRYPTFASHLRVEAELPEGLLLLAEGGTFHFRGRLFRELALLLDGSRTVEALVASMAGTFGAAEVHYALEVLRRGGHLVEADTPLPAAPSAFWHALGKSPREVARRLGEAEVEVLAFGEVPVDPVREALGLEGLRVTEAGGALAIAVVDDYLRAPLAELNREALRTGRPWLLVRPVGQQLWLGPRFVPGRSACWECLAQRLRFNRPVDVFLGRARAGVLRPARAGLETTVRAAAHLLASAVARGVATGDDGLLDTLVTLDVLGFGSRRHGVSRRPQCPACGEPAWVATRQRQPLVLESRPKRSIRDGGHRAMGAEETLRRHERHVSPVTGVVPRLEPVETVSAELAPVFDAGPNRARLGEELTTLLHSLRVRSSGKGMTALQARASALCEALERVCGAYQGDEARRLASLAELGPAAIAPERWLLFSERQYRERERYNVGRAAPYAVPHRFEPEWRISWSPAWSLTHGARRYLPTALCYYDFHEDGVPSFGHANSNGCAAGSCLEEAILQGFLELVERDAVALWWYNRLRRASVSLESFDEPYVRRLAGYYQDRGRELWVLDVTSDLGIPVFVAVSRRMEGGPERPLLGFGAHLDSGVALLRALTELNQALAAEPPAGSVPMPSGWWAEASLAEHAWLAPDHGQPIRSAQDFSCLASADLREDVETCVRLASARGLETVVLEQTRPDIGLAVARVVVPGLRHFWRRLAPGRLYDVPVQAGWLERPLAEEQLNPYEVTF